MRILKNKILSKVPLKRMHGYQYSFNLISKAIKNTQNN